MKKKRIAEGLYVVAALIFLGIALLFWKDRASEKEAGGNNITTVTPKKEGTPTKELPQITTSPVPEGEELPTTEVSRAPVTESVELPTVSETPDTPTPEATQEPTPTPAPTGEASSEQGGFTGITIKNEDYDAYNNDGEEWWFVRKNDHVPSGSGEIVPINDYNGYYLDRKATKEDKVVYLTFDCGYENGFTPSILDTLAEKNVKAMFFLTKSFVTSNPEYVKRMKEEGHLIGNHTVRHLSSPSLTPEELQAELEAVEEAVLEQTGYPLDPFFRPPMGAYSERTLKVAQDMGYSTIFWSIAYYDYDVNNQPGKEYVLDHFHTYYHNGAIVLMHNISQSDTEALGEVIDLWREQGYRFATLTELVEK